MCVKFREYGLSMELESVHEFLNSGLLCGVVLTALGFGVVNKNLCPSQRT